MAGKGKEKRGLGRGLEDLFGTAEIKTADHKGRGGKDSVDPENAIQNIDINEIRPNQDQPRQNFDEEKIAELADSILEHGIIEPLIVRKVKNGYEIVAGERRYRAARKAELKEVPCLIRELTDEQNMLFAIIENLQREDLNAIEEADAFDKMINAYGLTQEQVSKSVGKSRPYIANALRLLKLPEEIRSMVVAGDISSGHARALINITDEKKQMILARRAKDEGLTVRTIEQLAGELTPTTKPGKKPAKKKKDPDVARVEEELKKVVGTKVRINGKGSKGKIEIEYYSRDELERLIDLLRSLQ
ncbi:MAG: ParB/RepB/Spo0J family partition protein [Firmicutes bacterium]|nr:ParB/RepB/Spo0J family partition protein [Bacillota bacterium]